MQPHYVRVRARDNVAIIANAAACSKATGFPVG